MRGRIHGEGDLLVEGNVEGDVAVRGDLRIADGANVSSESVEAHAISIAGSVEAEVTASGPIRLEASAEVRGTLRAPAVAIADGARFAGRLDCEFELPPELGGVSRGESRGRTPARR